MSFSTVASYSNDKPAIGNVQNYEEFGADFFEQFLTFDGLETEVNGYDNLPEPAYLERNTSDCSSSRESLSSTNDEARFSHRPAAPWTPSIPASAQFGQFYGELSGRAALSDSELLRLEGFNIGSPQAFSHVQHSLPPSPSPLAAPSKRRAQFVQSLTHTFKKASGGLDRALLRSPIRKTSTSPTIMRSSHRSAPSGSQRRGKKLQQDMSKFNFEFPENSRDLTPPLTSTVLNSLDDSMSIPIKNEQTINDRYANNSGTGIFETPLTTPVLESHHSRNSSAQHSNGAFFPVTPQNQSIPSSYSQISSPPACSSSPIYTGMEEQPLWWNHAAAVKMAQPAPSGFHANPQRATRSLAMQLQNGLAYDNNGLPFDTTLMNSGLMIQMPGMSSQQGNSCDVRSPVTQSQGIVEVNRPQPLLTESFYRYPQASMRQPQYSQTSRTLSGSSDSEESLSPKSSSKKSFQIQKRKSPKIHKVPRTPSLGGSADFVNFTPSDSKRILTGVAPSGSSKTKARREKEALEKRRKLSQAAVRAVRAAGGDIESLVEQGLFV